ncbi:MAG: hypothetical protein WAT18_06630 [Sphingorhabdus sp.]
MRSNILALAALGFSSSVNAQTALPPVIASQIATLPIEHMCSKEGASGLKFGATEHDISPIHKPGSINRDLGTEFAPFRCIPAGS